MFILHESIRKDDIYVRYENMCAVNYPAFASEVSD